MWYSRNALEILWYIHFNWLLLNVNFANLLKFYILCWHLCYTLNVFQHIKSRSENRVIKLNLVYIDWIKKYLVLNIDVTIHSLKNAAKTIANLKKTRIIEHILYTIL